VRIALFCPSYGQVGGIETKADRLITAFRSAGHDVTVLARGEASRRSHGAVPVMRAAYHQSPRRVRHVARHVRFLRQLPGAVRTLRRAVSEAASDVVLTLAISSYAAYIAALTACAPVVLSLEGGEPGGQFTANPRLLRWALRRATRVVACARSLGAAATALAPDVASRLTVIPNGVDPERFADGPTYSHPRPYLVAVGRLVPQKGFDVLLEAFAGVASDVDLLIAGDGPERGRLESLRDRHGLTGRVRFLGTADPAAVAPLFRGALLVVCPSRWEGLPLVSLEAMASGRAVVASAVDGIPDAVIDGETGVLVPPDDPRALTRAIESLLGAPDRRERLGARGAALVRERFTWASVAERYLAVLESAAGR